MTDYGQFCPVAKAMEVLDERWTILIVRELLCGSTHFNQLRRGVPKMSPALLSKRLRTLQRVGIIDRHGAGNRTSYELTQRGRELRPAVEALGLWGLRWIGDLGDRDLDPHLLMWDVRRTIDASIWPAGRTVVLFTFSDVAARRWWLVVADGAVDLCDYDPGHDVDLFVTAPLLTLTRVWRGERSWEAVIRAGEVTARGDRSTADHLGEWVGVSHLAQGLAHQERERQRERIGQARVSQEA